MRGALRYPARMFSNSILEQAKTLFTQLRSVPKGERIELINQIRLALREYSPLKDEPVDCVLWVKADTVQANDYNPNIVAPPEMKLLQRSIVADGYTQPIVVWRDGDALEVVDGFHRSRVGKESKLVVSRTKGHLPVSVINTQRTAKEDRMASTIRHNRARGTHQVDGMSEIVADLAKRNWSDHKIAKELGMEADEVLRLKQITGLAELFADRTFSQAWETNLDPEKAD